MAVHSLLSVVLAFALTSISTLVVALRFYTRHFVVGKLCAADWMMLLALLAAWFSVVVNWYVVLFMDYSRIHDRETWASAVTHSLLSFWIYRLSYILDLCLVKTSILLFYNCIASSRKSFRHLVQALLAINLIGSASMIIAAVFTCYPISDAWSFEVFENGFKGILPSQCYNPGPFWLANASYNLLTDVLIWTSPIVFLLNLRNMPTRRRFELTCVFSIGIIAIVASAVRLRIMVLWLSSWEQQAANTANIMIWSQVEQNTGIIAGSIPFLRPLYRRAFFKVTSREHLSPGPAIRLIHDTTHDEPPMLREPIIPSPSPTFDERKEFSMPKAVLPPIVPVRMNYAWGSAVWDGTQVRQVLNT